MSPPIRRADRIPVIIRIPNAFVAALTNNNHQGLGLLLVATAALLIAAGRLWQFSGYSAPPGSDGGQWLAFAHQLFGGERVRSGIQSYPPVFPFLVRIISFQDGLLTLKLLGILASVLICLPAYLLLQPVLRPVPAALLAGIAALTPYQAEVLSFGGYPQLLGTVFLVLALFSLMKGITTLKKTWFLAGALATTLTIGTNILPAVALFSTLAISLPLWYATQRQRAEGGLRYRVSLLLLWWAVPSFVLSLAFSGSYLEYLAAILQGGASQRDLPVSAIVHWLTHSWQWEAGLWLGTVIACAGAAVFGFRRFAETQRLLFCSAAGLLISGLGGIFVLRELRFGALVEIGLVLFLGLAIRILADELSARPTRARIAIVTLVAIFVFGSAVGAVGERRFRLSQDWYRVLDHTSVSALEWLRDNRIPGTNVAATHGEHGNIYGWWIEGFAHMPALMTGDSALFIGAAERDLLLDARRLLAEETEPGIIRNLADQQNIRFLFIDTGIIGPSTARFEEAGFQAAFREGQILVMSRAATSPASMRKRFQ